MTEKTYKFDEPILIRADGSYIVQYNDNPYHVCETSVAVTLADVAEYLADHSDAEVKPEA